MKEGLLCRLKWKDGTAYIFCPIAPHSAGHSTRKQRSLDSAVLNVTAMYTQAATSLPYIAYSLQAFLLKYQLSLSHSPYCRPPVRRSLSPVSRLPLSLAFDEVSDSWAAPKRKAVSFQPVFAVLAHGDDGCCPDIAGAGEEALQAKRPCACT